MDLLVNFLVALLVTLLVALLVDLFVAIMGALLSDLQADSRRLCFIISLREILNSQIMRILPHSAQRKDSSYRKAEECYIFSLDRPATHPPPLTGMDCNSATTGWILSKF